MKSVDYMCIAILLAIALGISIVNQWAIHYQNKAMIKAAFHEVLIELKLVPIDPEA